MLSIAGLLIFAATLIRFFPKTPSGALMHKCFVELPVKVIEKTERKHIIFLIFGLLMIQGFASVVSIDWAILAALDASLYIDVVISVGVTASVVRTKSVWVYAKLKMQNMLPRRMKASARSLKTKPRLPTSGLSSSNDDERCGPLPLAA
jgi:hypothetical protein